MSARFRGLSGLFATVALLSACGGGGGGGASPAPAPGPVQAPAPAPVPVPAPAPAPTPPPAPTSFNLSGVIRVAQTMAVDSDTNDASQLTQGQYLINDSLAAAQPISSPVLLVGTVNRIRTGPPGNNFSPGDPDDYFRVDLVAGQTVELEFASDPADSDVDLYVIASDGSIGASSLGENTRYECVLITADKSYYINVYAFKSASIYSLRIGAPGAGSPCSSRTSTLAVPSQLLVKPVHQELQGARALSARLSAAGLGALDLPTSPSVEALPQLLSLPQGARQALGALVGDDNGRARRLAFQAGATAAVIETAAELAAAEQIALVKTAKTLQATGGFQYVQPNWRVSSQTLVGNFPPNDRNYALQRWHYEQINLPAAMARITALSVQPAQRPLVAVVDSGVVLDHPDLAPQLFSNGRAFISTTVGGDGNSASGEDASRATDERSVFHGTHVAGTVAAATYNADGGAGTAPMALILPLRVLRPDGTGTVFDGTQAMLYAARLPNNSGLLPERRADVINLSLGSDRACDAATQDAIAQVRAAGVVVVAAAGNSARNDLGRRAAVGSPANCSGAIAVSALDARRAVSFYSNTGTQIALAAPGGDLAQSTTGTGSPDGVYSTLATFDAAGRRQATFGGLMGTSMASPHVAGVMALIRYINPALTVQQIDTLVAQGALSDDLGTTGRDIDYGHGLVNAQKAVEAALATRGTPPSPAPAGRVVASPSTLDFGSFQSSAVIELAPDSASIETVTSVLSSNAAFSVVATAVDPATRLGRYTINLNRNALVPGVTTFARISVTLSTGRNFSVQLSATQLAVGGTAMGGNLGPLYVLLIDPTTGESLRSVLATRTAAGYAWSMPGVTSNRVSIGGGSDLDNDLLVCQRGESCGAFPLLGPGQSLTVLELTGDRSQIDFDVAPLAGISAQVAPAGGRPATAWSITPESRP